MPQDAFTLKFLCEELNNVFANGKINKIVQPDNDKVVFTIWNGKKTEKLLSKFVTKRIKQNGGSIDDETLLITYTKSGIESLFYRLRKELNFKKLHPHMLRHTFATYLIRKNASMDLIKNILGHSNYDMTLRYLHQNTSDLQKQLQLVDNAF